jgi:hypothetical protein
MIGSWWRKNVIEKVHAAAYSGKFTINNPIAYKFVQVCVFLFVALWHAERRLV